MTDSSSVSSRKLLLPTPRGFCAGVVRAVDIVRLALQRFGVPVYVRKEIVHNRAVVDELRASGAIFVDELDAVPDESVVVFSAHGVSPAVRAEAARRRMHVVDATCPLVAKVHIEAARFSRQGFTIVLIGHRDHDEIVGTLGEAPEAIHLVTSVADVDALDISGSARVACLTQTTLSVDETRDIIARLQMRFADLVLPAEQDICYATVNRQRGVKAIAGRVEAMLVVGSRSSSNSQRLAEIASRSGIPTYLVGSSREIQPEWIADCSTIGVTAGASTPAHLVTEVIHYLESRGPLIVEDVTVVDENVHFSLPPELL